MTKIRCPICGKSFDSQNSRSLPFCSDRCRQIDLGRWLKEGYSLPIVRQSGDEDADDARPSDDESGE
jgi:uncharacterized protein